MILVSCKETPKNIEVINIQTSEPITMYGYNLDNYLVITDTVVHGDSFGQILDRNHVDYPLINKIALTVKETFDVRRIRAGKPYVILAKKDSTEQAQVFIYQHNKIESTIIDFTDSIVAKKNRKPICIYNANFLNILTDCREV